MGLLSNISTTLLDQIKNYVLSYVQAQTMAYINYFDFSSNSQTTFSNNDWKKLVTNTTEGFSRDGLVHTNNRVTNTGTTKVFTMQAIVSVTGTNNNTIHFAFFKDGALVPCSEQDITIPSSGKYSAVPLQCIQELETNQYVEVWVKNANATATITLDNINVIISQS